MVEWTKHRFSGGLLALDLANTVVRRDDQTKRFDRLTTAESALAFAQAANNFRSEEAEHSILKGPDTLPELRILLRLREAIDAWVRRAITDRQAQPSLAPVFAACADATQEASPDALASTCAKSAMRLLDPALMSRVKICPACSWLFVDRSKNRSRQWCDMNVCGNRAKARKHYQLVKDRAS